MFRDYVVGIMVFVAILAGCVAIGCGVGAFKNYRSSPETKSMLKEIAKYEKDMNDPAKAIYYHSTINHTAGYIADLKITLAHKKEMATTLTKFAIGLYVAMMLMIILALLMIHTGTLGARLKKGQVPILNAIIWPVILCGLWIGYTAASDWFNTPRRFHFSADHSDKPWVIKGSDPKGLREWQSPIYRQYGDLTIKCQADKWSPDTSIGFELWDEKGYHYAVSFKNGNLCVDHGSNEMSYPALNWEEVKKKIVTIRLDWEEEFAKLYLNGKLAATYKDVTPEKNLYLRINADANQKDRLTIYQYTVK